MNHWIDQIDKHTQSFTELLSSLSREELNWRPNPDVWSIGQIVDHIMVINSSYFPELEALRSGNQKTPVMARFGFLVSFFGKAILKSVEPGRKKKIRTFPIWEPSMDHFSLEILENFINHQEELKKEIMNSQELIEKETVIHSPANRNIVYKLETAFEIMVTHEERHLEQARELKELVKQEPVQ